MCKELGVTMYLRKQIEKWIVEEQIKRSSNFGADLDGHAENVPVNLLSIVAVSFTHDVILSTNEQARELRIPESTSITFQAACPSFWSQTRRDTSTTCSRF